MGTKGFEFRFGVQDPHGNVSATFKIWSHKSDRSRYEIYIAPRGIRYIKASLHADGDRHYGFVSRNVQAKMHPRGLSRHWSEWVGLDVDEGITIDFGIIFPTELLTPRDPLLNYKNVTWFPAATPGNALFLYLYIVNDPHDALYDTNRVLATVGLADGRGLVLGGEVGPFGMRDIDTPTLNALKTMLEASQMKVRRSDRVLVETTIEPFGLKAWGDLSPAQIFDWFRIKYDVISDSTPSEKGRLRLPFIFGGTRIVPGSS